MIFGEKRLAVTFNLDTEMDIYELGQQMASSKQFSGWVKRLMRAELQRRKVTQPSTLTVKVGE